MVLTEAAAEDLLLRLKELDTEEPTLSAAEVWTDLDKKLRKWKASSRPWVPMPLLFDLGTTGRELSERDGEYVSCWNRATPEAAKNLGSQKVGQYTTSFLYKLL
jgi:hypothetical protein